MSYKIEITAETIAELTGKLLALAAATQPNDPVMPEVKEATKPKRAPKGNAADAPSSGEAEAAAKDTEDKANQPEATAEAAEPDTSSVDGVVLTSAAHPSNGNAASADVSAEALETVEIEVAAPEALDFDKDVAPVVLEAVKQRGKDWVSEILSQFGVARASQVADEQMGELVAALKEGLK